MKFVSPCYIAIATPGSVFNPIGQNWVNQYDVITSMTLFIFFCLYHMLVFYCK